ncbi:DHH family phosphoesterase [Clostridium aminobutyricum]|uniref:Bifunctional oligoribonuclease/PAP phosphatase NrnA n=1 Tax=Clostridium aminobutyricum TaxID=33953 RepID=A0A939D664_CLOAM|nr:bifunctional oligoribonuclease/PAP phosphatase NrnA [Clostridium aminobutyricum]MBN7772144.1 bifunctional oligoribonuclease/PAP phosphatase NrnA [Clostridium aminobutyricum]
MMMKNRAMTMSKRNNSLKEIADVLWNAESVLLYPHVNMDGDCLGSAVALCAALRKIGKEAYVLIEDEIAAFLRFMEKDYCTEELQIIKEPDVCICIDCGEPERFKYRKDKFFQGKTTICIDHHLTTEPFADLNYIDPKAAATGEIIYELLNGMRIVIDKEIGEALYAAIATDTGNFQYSNTTKNTHEIVAGLFDCGIDHNKVSIQLYQNIRAEKILLQNRTLQTLKLFAQGQAAICCTTKAMLEETGGKMEETEGFIEVLRSISGVEVAVFVKEVTDTTSKISMRSKEKVNVAEISKEFHGGGHMRAAGCTLNMGTSEAMETMIDTIERFLKG